MWLYFFLFLLSALLGAAGVAVGIMTDHASELWAVLGMFFLVLGCLGVGMWIQERLLKK